MAQLRSAAEGVDAVVKTFGDRHVPIVRSVASAAVDDTLEQLPSNWRQRARELSKALPEAGIKRTFWNEHVIPEESLLPQRARDHELAAELDQPLTALDGHQIQDVGVDTNRVTDELFANLAAQLRAGS